MKVYFGALVDKSLSKQNSELADKIQKEFNVPVRTVPLKEYIYNFFYFNDFYIVSFLIIAFLLGIIFFI